MSKILQWDLYVYITGIDTNMDDVLLTRLRLIHDKMIIDTGKIPSTLSKENLQQGQIIHSKLEATVRRFNADLNEYFRLVTTPAGDEISQMSIAQLHAEEALAELNVKIQTIISEIKENKSESFHGPSNVSSRLPKLNLPTFDGNVLNWHQFWDQFSSTIDNKNLPEVDKLSYLQASVSGDAKKAIDGLETTNRNYNIALKTLKDRFGKPSYLIDAHYSSLYKIETAKNSATECRKTFNEIERHLKILEALGEDVNHNHFRFLIMEKFPSEIIYEIKVKSNTECIQEIRSHLEKIITAREDADRIAKTRCPDKTETCTVEALHVQSQQRKYNHGRFHNKEDRFQRRDDMQKINPSDFQRKRKYEAQQKYPTNGNKSERSYRVPEKKSKTFICVFCEGAHYNDSCDKVIDISERKMKLKNRCYLCFKEGHGIKSCNRNVQCYYCYKYDHNRALCPKNFREVQQTKKTP